MSQPAFNPFNKEHQFDLAKKGPTTSDLREIQRKKRLAKKGKVDRTEEFRRAKQLLAEIDPEEVEASEWQDTILQDQLNFSEKLLQGKRHCNKNGIPFNEPDHGNLSVKGTKAERQTLDDIPIVDQRTQVAADIYANELEQTAKIYIKWARDVRQRGYFPRDLEEQKELIYGAHGFNLYLEPLYDNKISADWLGSFDSIAEQYRTDNGWSEERFFVRDIRYKIHTNGHISNEFPYTNEHITGEALINKINNIIMISDFIPFMKLVWLNNRKTRIEEQYKRNDKKYKRRNSSKHTTTTTTTNTNNTQNIDDPDDYDQSQPELHTDPKRTLIAPVSVKKMDEYDTFPEAYDLGFMRKSKPNDMTEYWKARSAYENYKLGFKK